MSKNTFFSLEDADLEELNPGDAAQDDVLSSHSELDDAMAEMDGYAVVASDNMAGVEVGLEALATLENLEEAIQPAIDSGEGLDPQAAEMVETAIESIRDRLGMPTKLRKSLPSMESFQSPRSRLAATKLALEDGVEKTSESILGNVFKKLAAIGDAFVKLFASLDSKYVDLEQKLTQYSAQAKSLKGEMKATEFKSKAIARAIGDGTQANAKTLSELIERTVSSVKLVSASKESLVSAIEGFQKSSMEKDDATKAAKTFTSVEEKLFNGIPKATASVQSTTHEARGPLIGGIVLSKSAIPASIYGIPFIVTWIRPSNSRKQVVTATALKPNEIAPLAKELLSAISEIRKANASVKADKGDLKTILQNFNRTSKDLKKLSRSQMNTMKFILSQSVRIMNNFYMRLPAETYAGFANATKYIGMSIANIQGSSAE